MMGQQFSADIQRMVQEWMATGQYASEDEVLLDAMLALEGRARREEELRTEIRRRIGAASTSLSLPLDRDLFKAEARRRFAGQK